MLGALAGNIHGRAVLDKRGAGSLVAPCSSKTMAEFEGMTGHRSRSLQQQEMPKPHHVQADGTDPH